MARVPCSGGLPSSHPIRPHTGTGRLWWLASTCKLSWCGAPACPLVRWLAARLECLSSTQSYRLVFRAACVPAWPCIQGKDAVHACRHLPHLLISSNRSAVTTQFSKCCGGCRTSGTW